MAFDHTQRRWKISYSYPAPADAYWARDGLLKGLNLDATIALAERISIPVIASGGLASIEDVKALLEPRAKKLAGAIAGRALYDGRLDPAAALALIRNARAAA